MSIDVTRLSVKELDALISQAKKRKATLSKRKPVAVVRQKLTQLARAEGYSIAELFGAGKRRRRARSRAWGKPASRRAFRQARSHRNTGIRPIPRRRGLVAGCSPSGWRKRSARAASSRIT